jgi:putative addiction module component (TIGR02574 family)
MKKSISVSDVAEFSISERIQFVEDVWDSIAKEHSHVSIPKEVKKELDKRLDTYHKTPSLGLSWQKVKKRILDKK